MSDQQQETAPAPTPETSTEQPGQPEQPQPVAVEEEEPHPTSAEQAESAELALPAGQLADAAPVEPIASCEEILEVLDIPGTIITVGERGVKIALPDARGRFIHGRTLLEAGAQFVRYRRTGELE